MSGKIGKLSATLLIAFIALSAICVFEASAQPPPPHRFYGSVTIAGESAPDATPIEAKIEGVTYASTTTVDGTYGHVPNVFDVPGDDPDTPEKDGGVNGETIEFYVAGTYATSWTFKSGNFTELDLVILAPLPPSPSIVSFEPPYSPVSDVEGATRTFSITVDQVVDVSWLMNDTEVFSDPGVTTSSYTNTSAPLGTWNVTAAASNVNGTATQMWIWNVSEVLPPHADFIANVTSGSEPLAVAFTDLSEYFDGITTWEWDFDNDGVIDSTEQNPTYTYVQDGVYTVSLNVTGVIDTSEARASATKVDYITVLDTEPTADFEATPTTGAAPLNVSFTDLSTSYDGIVSWSWTFGDEATSTEQNPTHMYEAVGNYTVTLTVSELDGDFSALTKPDYIVVTVLPPDTEPPVILYAEILYWVGAESARPDDPVMIYAIVTDNVGVTHVEVRGKPFEDTVPMEEVAPDMYMAGPIHVPWMDPGNYTLTITALDAADNKAKTTVTLVVAYAYTAYNVWLTDGWNLISLPLIPDNSSSEEVMAGVSILFEDLIRVYAELHPEMGWDVDAWMPTVEAVWTYDATTKKWLFYDPATGEGDLTEMKDGWGYWLKVSIPEELEEEERPPAILTVHGVEFTPGPVTPPEYHVVPGWNLIGYKSTYHMSASEYLRSIEGKYAKIYGYSPWAQCFYWVRDDEDMRPGYGYWIYMTEEGFIAP